MWSRYAVGTWLILTILVVGYELWCGLSGDPHTPTLTDVTVTYMPWWIILPFLFWLTGHFTIHYLDANGWAARGLSTFFLK